MDELINSINSSKGDYMSAGRNIYFLDLDTGEKLGLMGIPKVLDYNPTIKHAVIAPFGKNNSNRHYTGGDDTLELELSWWAEENDRTDVISRCKWLEAMSKADGDFGRPHLTRLMWGTMFAKSVWIITGAPYQMTDFNAEYGMRPTHAIQRVSLARYNPKNSRTEQIMDWRY